jgi:3-deoxy-D-manno-octulosonic-acid transferase
VIYLAVGDVEAGEKELNTIKDLQQQFNDRPIWMAASIHKGEEEGNHNGSAPFCY